MVGKMDNFAVFSAFEEEKYEKINAEVDDDDDDIQVVVSKKRVANKRVQ